MTIDPALQTEIEKTESRWQRLRNKRNSTPKDSPRHQLLTAAMERMDNHLHYLQSCKNTNPLTTL
jgi:hypothetical protein